MPTLSTISSDPIWKQPGNAEKLANSMVSVFEEVGNIPVCSSEYKQVKRRFTPDYYPHYVFTPRGTSACFRNNRPCKILQIGYLGCRDTTLKAQPYLRHTIFIAKCKTNRYGNMKAIKFSAIDW